MAFADVNTDVRRENTDVRWIGFLPPVLFRGFKPSILDECFINFATAADQEFLLKFPAFTVKF